MAVRGNRWEFETLDMVTSILAIFVANLSCDETTHCSRCILTCLCLNTWRNIRRNNVVAVAKIKSVFLRAVVIMNLLTQVC